MRQPPSGYEPLHHSVMIEQAKQHARTLRREAVPALWDGVDASCLKAARALTRFLQRLASHRQLRSQVHANVPDIKEV